MTNIKKIGFLAFATLTLTLNSCSSDDDNGGGGSNADTYINATVGGSAFRTLVVQGNSTAQAQKIVSGDHTFITISGAASDANTISIALDNVTGVGTYNVDDTTDNEISYVDFGTFTSYNSNSDCEAATGTIKITAYTDTKIEGTFTFTGTNDDNCAQTKVVTNGKFRGTFAN